jgi:ribonuclease HI
MYTDGGCHNTGDRKGDGSYAYLFYTDNKEYVDVYCEYIKDTTNNRMEMIAVIEGIKHIVPPCANEYRQVTIVSDSGYLVKGWTDPAYLERWVTNNWKTSTNSPVQNKDLWMKLQRLSWHVGFKFIHIRGHNKDKNLGHAFWNDICDKACTYMINKIPNPGFFVTLRYHFKTRKFEPIEIKLVEREVSHDTN